MNYYEHHIGDFDSATAHLSLLEDAIYRRLICLYYRSEAPIPSEIKQVCRLVRAISKQEKETVSDVLNEFFELQDDGWHNIRCDEEIARFQDKQAKAKRSADARWNKQKTHSDGNANAYADGMRTHSEGNAPRARPQTPITNHQSVITHTDTDQTIPEATPIASACIAIREVYDQHNHPPTDIAQANPTLQALIAAGATPDEFRDAAFAAMQANPRKGFGWIVARVRGQREQAAGVSDLTKPPIKGAINAREMGRNIAASSIFTPETTQHLRGNPQQHQPTEFEVIDEKL